MSVMQELSASPTRNGSRYDAILQLSSSLRPSSGIDFEVVFGQDTAKGSAGLGEEQTVDVDMCVSSRRERGEWGRQGQKKVVCVPGVSTRPVWSAQAVFPNP